ncbi:MAG: hypothetical protein SVK08_00760 [Halobacteriota archaeon]|nr:hypothetical protein [Halobacteriota archaeon]
MNKNQEKPIELKCPKCWQRWGVYIKATEERRCRNCGYQAPIEEFRKEDENHAM